jgi:hypothetical protein
MKVPPLGQVSATVPEKPPLGVTVTVPVPGLPATKPMVAGETLSVKVEA